MGIEAPAADRGIGPRPARALGFLLPTRVDFGAHSLPSLIPHRVSAACLAIAFLCSGVSFFIRAATLRLPSDTAAAFFLFLLVMGGNVNMPSGQDKSVDQVRATTFSRGGVEFWKSISFRRFKMFSSNHQLFEQWVTASQVKDFRGVLEAMHARGCEYLMICDCPGSSLTRGCPGYDPK